MRDDLFKTIDGVLRDQEMEAQMMTTTDNQETYADATLQYAQMFMKEKKIGKNISHTLRTVQSWEGGPLLIKHLRWRHALKE